MVQCQLADHCFKFQRSEYSTVCTCDGFGFLNKQFVHTLLTEQLPTVKESQSDTILKPGEWLMLISYETYCTRD